MNQKTKNILAALNAPGQFNRVVWRRTMRTRKDVPCLIEKIVSAVVSAGTDYANRKSVREAIENGERDEVQALPWGVWLDFPRVIAHTNKSKEYNEYIRLYPPSEAQKEAFANLSATAQYFINGKPASKAEIEPLCLASEFRDKEEPLDCITVNADNIISVGDKAV